MKLISKEKLVKGNPYFIECSLRYSGQSGKKIGIFDKLVYPCGDNPAFAQFIELKDLPNATIPTGMGTSSKNSYSTLNHKFYFEEKDMIFLKYIIDENTKKEIGSYIIYEFFNYNFQKENKNDS